VKEQKARDNAQCLLIMMRKFQQWVSGPCHVRRQMTSLDLLVVSRATSNDVSVAARANFKSSIA
jgi:hypothetical protein